MIVIDEGLSDELSGLRRGWRNMGRAIDEALQRATQADQVSVRRMGDDGSEYNQEAAIKDLVNELKLKPSKTRFTLTGAWVEDDGSGCVNSVRDVLETLGFKTVVEDAMDLDAILESEDEDEVESQPMSKAPRTNSRSPRRR